MTIFLGCGFAAKYREGGGVFSVPLQWMLGLKRLGFDAVWLEVLPATKRSAANEENVRSFQRRLREYGLGESYCLLYQKPASDAHDLERIDCIGMKKQVLRDRLAGPNTLLNLSYSIHPPLLLEFERRLFCDLDPSEIFYWMTKLEMGQSSHHEFWTIGLNVHGRDCRLPQTGLPWKTFFPMVDTKLYRSQPRPKRPKFSTIGQWYWSGAVEVGGEFPDLSKKVAFEPYLDLPKQLPEVSFELAMNMARNDPERKRLRAHGWQIVEPHDVARTPGRYRQYLATASGEFTAIKGVDVRWKTGWVSDRAAAFLALGRPVVTEDTGAAKYLPCESGIQFVDGTKEAANAVQAVLDNWSQWSKAARRCAVEVFDSAQNLRKILNG